MSSRDFAASSQAVRTSMVCQGRAAINQLVVAGGDPGQVLTNAGGGLTQWASGGSSGACCDVLQAEITHLNQEVSYINTTLNLFASQLTALTEALNSCCPLPPPPPGRTITFQNNTLATPLAVYFTKGAPDPVAPTIIATLNPTQQHVWPIPDTWNFSCNFYAWTVGYTGCLNGATLIEPGFNQTWPDPTALRDTWDISTVPPGIGSQYPDGPRDAAVALSFSRGYTVHQSRGYNFGMTITYSGTAIDPMTEPVVPVTANIITGDCPQSIGYPNDTAYPKQQTAFADGAYIVSFIDPVAVDGQGIPCPTP